MEHLRQRNAPADPNSRIHYPQSDDALCCCEYRDRRGDRAHMLQLFCACEEIDEAANKLLSGGGLGRDQLDEIIKEVDDRLRVPLPGGAWHIGLPGTVPWALLPPLLILGGLSARCLVLVSCSIMPALIWWHRRSLRLRRRSCFLLSWMLASLVTEVAIYSLALRFGFLMQSQVATASFSLPLLLTLVSFVLVKRVDPTGCLGVRDPDAATARSERCKVCAVRVPRYDHYCAWVNEPIGAANHRAYLLFVVSMSSTCIVGGVQLILAASRGGWSPRLAWEGNRSSVLLSCGCYGMAVGTAVSALLLHQVVLVWSGRTTYEARKERHRGGEAATPAEAVRRPLSHSFRSFLDQTAPLTVTAAAALRGRPAAADDDESGDKNSD